MKSLKKELLAEYANSLEKYNCFSVHRYRNGGFAVKPVSKKQKNQTITEARKALGEE